MRAREVAAQRLANQHLAAPCLDAVELVRAMGAIQAQDYAGALWAIGLRSRCETEASIESALAAGTILRTHPMRGTHHFVAQDDIRWLVQLMGPLMLSRTQRRNRELDLDERTLTRAMKAIGRALEDGSHLTRAGTTAVLKRARISPDGQRLAHIIYRAELEGLVCSGKREGKQITIALLSERAPTAKSRSREDSLRELATRYYVTRGPATRGDFAWWCRLPAADVREAMDLAKLDSDGTYFTKGPLRSASGPRALLLPPFDEFAVAYRDRSAAGTPPPESKRFGEVTLLGASVVLDGRIVGTWNHTANRAAVAISPWTKLTRDHRRFIEEAAARYAAFARASTNVGPKSSRSRGSMSPERTDL